MIKKLFLDFLRYINAIRDSFADHRFRVLFILAIFVLGLGTIFYHIVEGFRYIDAFYFSVTTLATIGYGDFAPVTDLGKVFTIFYIFTGLGIIAAFINTLSQRQIKSQMERNARFSEKVQKLKQRHAKN